MVDRLRAKLSEKKARPKPTKLCGSRPNVDESSASTPDYLVGNKHALKRERTVEFGWLHKLPDGTRKQVVKKKGGGTRKVTMDRDAKKDALLEKALELFFPAGKSPLGNLGEFAFDLTDFKEQPLDGALSVAKLSEDTGLYRTHFYLCTEKLASDVDNHQNFDADATRDNNVYMPISDDELPDINTVPFDASQFLMPIQVTGANVVSMDNAASSGANDDIIVIFDTVPLDASQFRVPSDAIQVTDLTLVSADNTALLSEILSPDVSQNVKIARLHRGYYFRDLMNIFKSSDNVNINSLAFEVILPNGHVEGGRGVGVTKDIITGFWDEFYAQCTVGNTTKVPFIRHDMQEADWKAIAHIFLTSWTEFKYIPLLLSQPFLEEVLFGNITVDMIESFLAYLSDTDRVLIKGALDDFSTCATDDIIDFLSDHECRKVATADSFKAIILEIAHKELIQEPSYVIRCWQPILHAMEQTMQPINLTMMFIDRKPTGKLLCRILKFPENVNAMEQISCDHLKRYVRNLDEKDARLFLRFATGFDIILCDSILVKFSSLEGFQRRPIAHTCTDVLELPVGYESYIDFRSELDSILHSGNGEQWLIDII